MADHFSSQFPLTAQAEGLHFGCGQDNEKTNNWTRQQFFKSIIC